MLPKEHPPSLCQLLIPAVLLPTSAPSDAHDELNDLPALPSLMQEALEAHLREERREKSEPGARRSRETPARKQLAFWWEGLRRRAVVIPA